MVGRTAHLYTHTHPKPSARLALWMVFCSNSFPINVNDSFKASLSTMLSGHLTQAFEPCSIPEQATKPTRFQKSSPTCWRNSRISRPFLSRPRYCTFLETPGKCCMLKNWQICHVHRNALADPSRPRNLRPPTRLDHPSAQPTFHSTSSLGRLSPLASNA